MDEVKKNNFKTERETIINFFKKYGVIFLIIIPIIVSAQIRMHSEDLPLIEKLSEGSAVDYYKNQMAQQVIEQYPNLPMDKVVETVNAQYDEFYKDNKEEVDATIKQASSQYKSLFQDENGYTYMPDIDPYNYLRYARNYLDHGHMGDIIVNGTVMDMKMNAPLGRDIDFMWHPFVLAQIYKVMHMFNSKITLMQSATYFPIIFIALSLIPIFFIGRRLAGNTGGFFAALAMAVNSALVSRTSWGHADTDAYAIFFATYVLWFVLTGIKQTDEKKTLLYASLAGLTLGLFSLVWSGWWYAFDFILAATGIYLVYLLFNGRIKEWKSNLELKQFGLFLILFIVMSGIFVSLFDSPYGFVSSIYHPLEFTTIKEAAWSTLWPNVYTTVAEMSSASVKTIIGTIGGYSILIPALIGMLMLLFMNKRKDLFIGALILIWGIGTTYAGTKGVRFVMMLVPAVVIGFGAFIGLTCNKIKEVLDKNKPEVYTKWIVWFIMAVVIAMLFAHGNVVMKGMVQDVPMVNDAWVETMNEIRDDSKPNAIITSWWDFGHHFKYLSDRAVTFDGASQNVPSAHWVGKILSTNNEDEAMGILRMLDCGSNNAFKEIENETGDSVDSIEILYEIFKKNKIEAKEYLTSKGLDVEKILPLTHCEPPEGYLITSEDMVGKSGVWAHFGEWNFDRAEVWLRTKNLPQNEAVPKISERLHVSETEAKKIYIEVKSMNEREGNDWIAPWPGYSDSLSCTNNAETLDCGNGILIDLTTKEIVIGGTMHPTSFIYLENNTYQEKKYDDGAGGSVILISGGGANHVISVSDTLANSMFTRLFFMNGEGLEHFEKFSDVRDVTGARIIVWKVKW